MRQPIWKRGLVWSTQPEAGLTPDEGNEATGTPAGGPRQSGEGGGGGAAPSGEGEAGEAGAAGGVPPGEAPPAEGSEGGEHA